MRLLMAPLPEMTQLIPARGRKLLVAVAILCVVRHNLSPRGDGNGDVQQESGKVQDTTYPREGTETWARRQWEQEPLDTTYPREGTETYFCFALLSLLSNLTQLIPARGRKRFDLLFFRHLYPTQLIPARGRKLRRRHNHVKVVGHNLSPRGDGNAAAHRAVKPCAATQLIPARGRKPNLGPGALL